MRLWGGKIKYILAVVLLGGVSISPLLYVDNVNALPSWSQIQPSGNWSTAALSGNGQYGLIGAESGHVYLVSDNNVVTQMYVASTINQGVLTHDWVSTAVNKTGSHLLASEGSSLYINKSSGVGAWSSISPDPNAPSSWRAIDINNTGNKIVAGNETGLYISNNAGASWTETQPSGNGGESWWTASMSGNCDTILAGTYGKRLYLSKDGGVNWQETQPSGDQDQDWRVNDVKANGQILFVAARYGRAYISINGGDTWTETQPKGDVDEAWMRGQISDDGQTAVISADSGRIYVTTNGGDTWTETQPSGNNNRYWYAVAMDDNGDKMLAGAYSHNLYVSGSIGDGAVSDSDGDGKDDDVEGSGPNSGDANGDGYADNAQANIASYVNTISGQRVVLEVSQGCALDEVASVAESTNADTDADFNYPAGMLDFSATTNTPGGSTTIKQYYYGLTDNPNYVVRKYDPRDGLYSTIIGATVQQVVVGGSTLLEVTYLVVDGGPLDTDGLANGRIVDPAGIALAATTNDPTANDGIDPTSLSGVGSNSRLRETGYELWLPILFSVGLLTLMVFNNRLATNRDK